ncbi:TPA: hypothetical protein HA265_02305 [Candidatus Woesearchaeota archaeon]|nr:hypothetical protein [Candidatus Woesearchaeota archaeon]
MDENFISKVAVVCVVLGLVLLFVFLQTAKIEDAGVEGIEEHDEETVFVEGVVLTVKEMEGVTFVMLERSETMDVTLFGPTPSVETGDLVQIRGEITVDPEGRAEMTGEEMRVVG